VDSSTYDIKTKTRINWILYIKLMLLVVPLEFLLGI